MFGHGRLVTFLRPISVILAFILFFCLIPVELISPEMPGGMAEWERSISEKINGCTTGIAAGFATPDNRPLLWKNRDVSQPGQEYHYVDDGGIPFISLTYMNDSLMNYYGGVNAAGVALENSDSHNMPYGPAVNGWGGDPDDGETQALALATYRTVDDFQALLDSLNVDGRTSNSNFGTFDAFGNAAMFETGGYSYVRYDAADQPYGFIVRSNYSYAGQHVDQRHLDYGANRHDRAYALFKRAAEENSLTHKFIIQQISRNLHASGMEDYAIPYEGYYGDAPYGAIPNSQCICRLNTRSVFVAHGIAPGENPARTTIWGLTGSSLTNIAAPLWVRAGSAPPEFDSPTGSCLCSSGRNIADYLYVQWIDDGDIRRNGVNTFMLRNEDGVGERSILH